MNPFEMWTSIEALNLSRSKEFSKLLNSLFFINLVYFEILTFIYFYFSGFAYIGIARLFNFYPFGQKQEQQSSQIQTIQIPSEEKWNYQEK